MTLQGDAEVTWSQRIKNLFLALSFFFLLSFMILATIRLDSDVRGSSGASVTLSHVLLPLGCALACLLLWTVVNYFSNKPLSSAVPTQGISSQFLYNLLTQLLVKKVSVASIEAINEASLFRDILRAAAYALIITYAFLASTYPCKGCDVPYQMLGLGLGSTFAVRFLMLMINGFYSFHRYEDMALEVRMYQESLDQTRLFDNAVTLLYESANRVPSMILDAFLFCVSLTFTVMGSMWVQGGSCAASCATAFHLYEWLLICIYFTEGCNVISKFLLLYYERMSNIEGLDALVKKIEERK